MSRILSVLGIVSALALGSCVSQQAASSDFAWSFQDNEGEGPKLAYGAPNSDNIVLMMACEAGSERVNLSLLGGSPETGMILTSGGRQAHFTGEPVVAPGAGHMIETEAHVDAPPLARFEKTGALTLVDRGRDVKLDASGSERAEVKRFFRACRV